MNKISYIYKYEEMGVYKFSKSLRIKMLKLTTRTMEKNIYLRKIRFSVLTFSGFKI